MSPHERTRALTAGFVAGIAGGLFGVGGGIILVPMLTGWLGLTQHQAHGTSLAVMGFTALSALVVYGAASHVSWSTGLALALTSVWAARWGASRASRTSAGTLRRAFAVFLGLVALRLLWKAPEVAGAPLFEGWPRLAFAMALGTAVGLLSGFLGVGGGILAVPGLTLGLSMSQQAAQGTSLAVILFTAPMGAFEHGRHGNVVWRLVPALAIGSIVGAPLTSWLALRTPHEVLVRVFALFVIVGAVIIWRHGRP